MRAARGAVALAAAAAAVRLAAAYTQPTATATQTRSETGTPSPSFGTSRTATRTPTGTRTHTGTPSTSPAFAAQIAVDVQYNLTVGNSDVFLTVDATAFGVYAVTMSMDCLGVNTSDFGGAVTLYAGNGGPPPCTGCAMPFSYTTRVDCFSVYSNGLAFLQWTSQPGGGATYWYLRLHRDAVARPPYRPTLTVAYTVATSIAPTPTGTRTMLPTYDVVPLGPLDTLWLGAFAGPGANTSVRYWVWSPADTPAAAAAGGNVSSYGVFRLTLQVFAGEAVVAVSTTPPAYAGYVPPTPSITATAGAALAAVGKEATAGVVDVTVNQVTVNDTYYVVVACTVGNPTYSLILDKVVDSDGYVPPPPVPPPPPTDLTPIIVGVVFAFLAFVAAGALVVWLNHRAAERRLTNSSRKLPAAAADGGDDEPEDVEVGHGIVRHRPKYSAAEDAAAAGAAGDERKDAPRARPLVHVALIHAARQPSARLGVRAASGRQHVTPHHHPPGAAVPAAAAPVGVDGSDGGDGGGGGGASSATVTLRHSGSASPPLRSPGPVVKRTSTASTRAKHHAAFEAALAADVAAAVAEAAAAAPPPAADDAPPPPQPQPQPHRKVMVAHVHAAPHGAAHARTPGSTTAAGRKRFSATGSSSVGRHGGGGGGSGPGDVAADIAAAEAAAWDTPPPLPPPPPPPVADEPAPAAPPLPAPAPPAALVTKASVRLAPIRRASVSRRRLSGSGTPVAASGGGGGGGGSAAGGDDGAAHVTHVTRVVHRRGSGSGSGARSGSHSPDARGASAGARRSIDDDILAALRSGEDATAPARRQADEAAGALPGEVPDFDASL